MNDSNFESPLRESDAPFFDFLDPDVEDPVGARLAGLCTDRRGGHQHGTALLAEVEPGVEKISTIVSRAGQGGKFKVPCGR
jgi:hypothetical protein